MGQDGPESGRDLGHFDIAFLSREIQNDIRFLSGKPAGAGSLRQLVQRNRLSNVKMNVPALILPPGATRLPSSVLVVWPHFASLTKIKIVAARILSGWILVDIGS
jgi:hypothetical protein